MLRRRAETRSQGQPLSPADAKLDSTAKRRASPILPNSQGEDAVDATRLGAREGVGRVAGRSVGRGKHYALPQEIYAIIAQTDCVSQARVNRVRTLDVTCRYRRARAGPLSTGRGRRWYHTAQTRSRYSRCLWLLYTKSHCSFSDAIRGRRCTL
jgi:hypothetical protein